MTKPVSWRRLAEKDLTEVYLFIGHDSPEMAEKLLDAVEHAMVFLLANPRAGRIEEFTAIQTREIRSWAIQGFRSYLIFYRTTPDGLEILRLLHSARDLPRHFDSGDEHPSE